MANNDNYASGYLKGTLSEPVSLTGYLNNVTLRGIPIELRIEEGTYILQWKYLDETDWQDLIDLNNLNYEELQNKPTINDITLIGNLTPEVLGLSTRAEGIATISRSDFTYTVTRPDGSTFSFDQLDQENVIESVSVNGTQLAVNNKNVDVAVPTAVSELTNDSNYAAKSYVDSEITALDTKAGDEISALDAKIDGEISTLDTKLDNEITSLDTKIDNEISATNQSVTDLGATLSSTATEIRGEIQEVSDSIPTAVSELTNDANYATQSYVDSGIDSISAAIPTKVSDLTNDASYTTKTYVDTELAKKQDTLPMREVTSADIGKALMPKTVSNGEVTSWEFGEAGMVDDVTINGTSIVNNKVAEIPVAGSELGVVKISNAYGVSVTSNGTLSVQGPNDIQIKGGTYSTRPITPYQQHTSTFYGLAKAAGADMASSSNAVGTYTDAAKTAIQSMLGIDTAIANAVGQITGFDFSVVQELPVSGVKGIIYLVAHSHGDNDGYDEYIWINDGFEKLGHCDIDLTDYATIDYVDSELENKVDDVQIEGTSIVSNGIANIPLGGTGVLGVVKVENNSGLSINASTGQISTSGATVALTKSGLNGNRPITPDVQHSSAFYGLAKAAGDSTQSASANAVGTYTDDAKSAIQTMLGVPADDEVVKDVQINGTSIVSNGAANIPIAASGNLGVVKTFNGNFYGINVYSGELRIVNAQDSDIKVGWGSYQPITAGKQHQSVFYGLAQAAGDTTQSQSANTVGTYTPEAKAAIQTMLGIPDAISAAVPTNNNQLTNGAGYQTASDVETAITTALSTITEFRFEVVNELPATGENGVVYLLSHGGSETNNDYDEYIWVTNNNESGFEKLGTLALDLSGYLQTNDTITSAQIQALFA